MSRSVFHIADQAGDLVEFNLTRPEANHAVRSWNERGDRFALKYGPFHVVEQTTYSTGDPTS